MKTLSYGIKIIDTDWSCLSLKPDRECSSWAVTGNTWESLLTCPSYPHCQVYVVPRQEVWRELNLLLATLKVAECEVGLSRWARLVLMRKGVGNCLGPVSDPGCKSADSSTRLLALLGATPDSARTVSARCTHFCVFWTFGKASLPWTSCRHDDSRCSSKSSKLERPGRGWLVGPMNIQPPKSW